MQNQDLNTVNLKHIQGRVIQDQNQVMNMLVQNIIITEELIVQKNQELL